MITLIELEERVRLLTEENIALKEKVFDYVNQKKQLKEWLEDYIKNIKIDYECSHPVRQYSLEIIKDVLESTLAKIEELESGKNESIL